MAFNENDVKELELIYGKVEVITEAGVDYIYICNIQLPNGCNPTTTNALLCPSIRDGYNSRLFFPNIIESAFAKNWNANNVRLFGKSWFACSWQTQTGLDIIQMVESHLDAFKKNG